MTLRTTTLLLHELEVCITAVVSSLALSDCQTLRK